MKSETLLLISDIAENILSPKAILFMEHFLRPMIMQILGPEESVKFYSQKRKDFVYLFNRMKIDKAYVPIPEDRKNLERKLWNITFRGPLMNSAGMSKNGELFNLFLRQGAAGFLGGTTTAKRRKGETANEVNQPFISLPYSGVAINKLALPNDGDEMAYSNIVKMIEETKRFPCPIGWSDALDDGIANEQKQMEKLVSGMKIYEEMVDFLELDVSCPNINGFSYGKAEKTLQYVGENFLNSRKRKIPVVPKFSLDVEKKDVPKILDALFKLGYDGINFGNTSTNYDFYREKIDSREKSFFDYFIKSFQGGISGKPLKERSLELCARAVEYKNAGKPNNEFHVIRTGGIENASDLIESDKAGISMNQFFTGYFPLLAVYGNDAFKKIYGDYLEMKKVRKS